MAQLALYRDVIGLNPAPAIIFLIKSIFSSIPEFMKNLMSNRKNAKLAFRKKNRETEDKKITERKREK